MAEKSYQGETQWYSLACLFFSLITYELYPQLRAVYRQPPCFRHGKPTFRSEFAAQDDPVESSETGVVSLHYLQTEVQPSAYGTYSNLTTGTSFLALFRDAFRAMVVFKANPTDTVTPANNNYE